MQPTFSMQAVSSLHPNEFYEVLDMTPDVQSWAAKHLPKAQHLYTLARNAVASALPAGKFYWESAGGPAKVIDEAVCMTVFNQVEMLSRGKTFSNSNGWIDRQAWNLICDVLKSADKNE